MNHLTIQSQIYQVSTSKWEISSLVLHLICLYIIYRKSLQASLTFNSGVTSLTFTHNLDQGQETNPWKSKPQMYNYSHKTHTSRNSSFKFSVISTHSTTRLTPRGVGDSWYDLVNAILNIELKIKYHKWIKHCTNQTWLLKEIQSTNTTLINMINFMNLYYCTTEWWQQNRQINMNTTKTYILRCKKLHMKSSSYK